MNELNQKIVQLVEEFANSGWTLIAAPAQAWLRGENCNQALIAAVERAEKQCGGCGCELDQSYRDFLILKDFFLMIRPGREQAETSAETLLCAMRQTSRTESFAIPARY
ncbi:MAG: hypothetical protein AB7F32_03805 [Victivallaceae bacterium]